VVEDGVSGGATNSFRGAFRREVKRFISRVGCERRSEDPLALDRLRGCRAPKPSIKSAFSFHQERRPHLLDQVWIADLAPDPTGPSEALGSPAGPPEKMEIPSYTGQSVWSPLPFPLSSLRRQGRAQTVTLRIIWHNLLRAIWHNRPTVPTQWTYTSGAV